MEQRDIEEYRHKRKWMWRFGVPMVWLGSILLPIDVILNFPTPLRGPGAAAFWLLVIIIGSILWRSSKRLPFAECIELAKVKGGSLFRADIITTFGLTKGETDEVVRELQKAGQLREHFGESVDLLVFKEVVARKALDNRPAGSRLRPNEEKHIGPGQSETAEEEKEEA